LQEKLELEEKFEKITNEVKMHADNKNVILMGKLNDLEKMLEAKVFNTKQKRITFLGRISSIFNPKICFGSQYCEPAHG